MSLGEYLAKVTKSPWVWGESDCCTLGADWVAMWGWGDPMAKWRGKYSDEATARAFIAEAGGLASLWGEGLACVGARAVDALSAGNVGVITVIGMDGRPDYVGAIYTGRRWAFRAQSGLFIASAEFTHAWARPDE